MRGISILLSVIFLSLCAPLSAFAQEYVPGEVIVKLKGKSKGITSQAFIGKAVAEKNMNLKGSWSGINMHHFALKPGQDVKDAVKELQNDPDVEYVEPNYIIRKQSAGIESQMSMTDFYSMSGGSNGSFAQTSAPIQASQGWAAASNTSTKPIVAVIDTGVDYNHTVFVSSGAIWTNTGEVAGNGVDDDGNGYIDDVRGWNFVSRNNNPWDDDGHGTHVAGIVLGATQDIQANPIAASKIRIMPLKFLDANGSGSTSDAIQAIYYAVNNGAQVLNNSWGGGGYSNSLLTAIAYAYDQKRVFVAAAGNANNNNDSSPTYPANYNVPNMLSIAASTDWDTKASFSNYGATTVHMGSPGVSVLSTLPNNSMGYSSGTSMAAPFVAGVAALMVREAPSMNGYQLKNLMFSSNNVVSGLSGKVSTSSRLNVLNSVNTAKAASVDGSQPSYDASANFRAPASEASQAAPVGCGLVGSQFLNGGGGSGPAPMRGLSFYVLLAVVMAPMIVVVVLRHRAKMDGKNRRRHERFMIDSAVRVKVGERELVGSVSTISLGGAQLNTEAMLEKGGIVTMTIASPDGRDEIQVKGMIVWSEEHKHYGVQFAETNQSVLSTISQWTQGLLRAN